MEYKKGLHSFNLTILECKLGKSASGKTVLVFF